MSISKWILTIVVVLAGIWICKILLSGNGSSEELAVFENPTDVEANAKADIHSPSEIHLVDSPFNEKLLEIAANYKYFGHVDDEARWAPYLCRMPNPSVARFSQSDDEMTHGQKLYYLIAKDRDAYLNHGEKPADVGQFIVKESWKPKISDKQLSDRIWKDIKRETLDTKTVPNDVPLLFLAGASTYPYVTKDGQLYEADEISGLFIMYKTDKHLDETDEGWVYGTVSADGKTVTAAGRVESCMECHQEAVHDRLFGLPKPGL